MNINIFTFNKKFVNYWKDGYNKTINNSNENNQNSKINTKVNITRCENFDSKIKGTKENQIAIEKAHKNLEEKGEILFPTSNHMSYYENKVNLFSLFKKCNVKIPDTWHVTNLEDALNLENTLVFPIILKKPFYHSSIGIQQCYSKIEYRKIIKDFFTTNKECIIQKKLNFTKEARLSYVGYNLFHGYYRIKKNCNQVSGCTRFGSVCSFDIDLKEKSKIIKSFVDKTGYDIGGLDIVWENDDETQEPYVLEVSPIFSLNPPTPPNWNKSYNEFKNHHLFKDFKKKTVENACEHIVNYVIEKYSRPVIYCDIDSTINNHEVRIKRCSIGNKINPEAYTYDEIMKDLPLEDAIESNHKLYEKYSIYFITARKRFPNGYNSTRDWLNKYGFRYDKIILTNNTDEKISIIKQDPNLKVFIDDCTINHQQIPIINEAAIKKINLESIPFIIFNNNWNDIVKKLSK